MASKGAWVITRRQAAATRLHISQPMEVLHSLCPQPSSRHAAGDGLPKAAIPRLCTTSRSLHSHTGRHDLDAQGTASGHRSYMSNPGPQAMNLAIPWTSNMSSPAAALHGECVGQQAAILTAQVQGVPLM